MISKPWASSKHKKLRRYIKRDADRREAIREYGKERHKRKIRGV